MLRWYWALWLAAARGATPYATPQLRGFGLIDVQEIGLGLAARNLSAIQKVLITVANSSNGTEEVLHEMEEIVNETLEPSVKRDFEMAQFEIIEFHTLFLKCEEDQHEALSQSASQQKQIIHLADEHLMCRKHLVLLMDASRSCETLQQAARTVVDARCALEHSSAIPDVTACHAWPDEDPEAYHERKIKDFEASLAQILERKKACEEAKAEVVAQEARCSKAAQELINGHQECDEKQLRLDSAVCALQSHMATSCEGYRTCRSAALSGVRSVNATVQSAEAEVQATWTLLTKVRCMIEGAQQKNVSKVQMCLEQTNVSLKNLTINYTTVPAVTPCQTLVEAPGSPDYMEALYGHVPKRAPASACQASCCH